MNKYIPTYLAQTVYDIDFVTLYEQGKRVILFDLDNTLASYEEAIPTEKQLELNKYLRKLGYKIYIVSNNREPRTKLYTTTFVVDNYLVLARKPFTRRITKFLKKENINKNGMIMIGDQLLTDICCANKLGVDCYLVHSISRKTEKWYTKINRKREKIVLRKIEKKNEKLANEIRKIIGNQGDHYE